MDRAEEAVGRLIAPLLWDPITDLGGGTLHRFGGVAPDPLRLGYSKPFGIGLGLDPSRYIDTTHCAVYWTQGPKTPTPHPRRRPRARFQAWYGAPKWGERVASAHDRLQKTHRDRVFAQRSADFLRALNTDPDVVALLRYTANTRLAFLFPPSTCALGDKVPFGMRIAHDSPDRGGCITRMGGQGFIKPYPLRMQAA